MAISSSIWTSLINSGIVGLAAVFGAHNSAANAANLPLALIKANLTNLDAVKANAQTLVTLLAASNPVAAATASAIVANPAAASNLLVVLENEISENGDTILSHLTHAIAQHASLPASA